MSSLPKFKSYTGGDLDGIHIVTRKLDGVCVYLDCTNRTATSKRGKPLYNFEGVYDLNLPVGYYEVFNTDWETTVSMVRTRDNSELKVKKEHLYSIYPMVDQRLHIDTLVTLPESLINDLLQNELSKGNEGLVLIDERGKRIKVKDKITIDVRVTGVQPGKGKYEGMIGALITSHGKVGTGLSDEQRGMDIPVGSIIEVEFMEWTPKAKMRHPRLLRVRWDKDTENVE